MKESYYKEANIYIDFKNHFRLREWTRDIEALREYCLLPTRRRRRKTRQTRRAKTRQTKGRKNPPRYLQVGAVA